jgi:hypothetical protein
MLDAAQALTQIRTQLYELVKSGQWPSGSFETVSTIMVSGLCVSKALERLANDCGHDHLERDCCG